MQCLVEFDFPIALTSNIGWSCASANDPEALPLDNVELWRRGATTLVEACDQVPQLLQQQCYRLVSSPIGVRSSLQCLANRFAVLHR